MTTFLIPFLWAFGLTVFLGPLLIPVLRRLKIRQTVRSDGPATHLGKTGTPTMGGLIFIPGIVLGSLLMGKGAEILLIVAVMLGYAGIGLADDALKAVFRRPLGLRARYKLAAEILLGVFLAIGVVGSGIRTPEVTVPLFGGAWWLGWYYVPFVIFVLIATTNSVNLTDGLDGLAIGVCLIVALGYALIGIFQGSPAITAIAASLAGACLGFLLFNRYPAMVFMGDTGSLALGAVIAGLAIVTGTELVLPVMGGVFVLEALSVILQVASFRLTGKRLFRMSPLHHHFELLGWPEKKVVRLFYLAAAVFSAAGVLLVSCSGRVGSG